MRLLADRVDGLPLRARLQHGPHPLIPKAFVDRAASRRASSCVPGRKHSAPLAAVALSREIQSMVASADQYGSIWLSVCQLVGLAQGCLTRQWS